MDKGPEFEREFCKRLSLWWTAGERDDIFWRTANSGGRATVRKRKGKGTSGQYGDVGATDPLGEPLLKVFTFELKRGYNRATLHDLFDRRQDSAEQKWDEWIDKACLCHKRSGSRSWLIVHKRDRREALVVFPERMQERIGLLPNAILAIVCWPGNFTEERLAVMRLDDFLEFVAPDKVREVLNDERGISHVSAIGPEDPGGP